MFRHPLYLIIASLIVSHTSFAQQLPAPARQRDAAAQVIPTPLPAQPQSSPVQPFPDDAPPVRHESLPPVTPPTPPDDTIIYVPEKTPTTPPVAKRRASVGGFSIYGMTDVAAVSRLRSALAAKLAARVTLSDGANEYQLSRSELGATIPLYKLVQQARATSGDVPLRFEVDTVQTQRILRTLATRINRAATPVSLDVTDGQAIMRGGDGIKVAVEGSAWRVKQALEAQPPQSRVEIIVARTPAGKAGQSETGMRQFRYLIGSFSSPYDARLRGRTNNLRIAARNVNGTVVPAGGVFSTNRAIGPRNAADGWREAKMFVSGQVVSGVGAGICQCASNLYNAALLAGLPIVERHPHMFRVPYVPASRDATIYWGSKDMRFRNNTSGPIYIQTFLSKGRFHVRLYGTEPPRHNVEVESRTISRRKGTLSEAYRVMRTDTGVQRVRLSRDYYMPHP